MYVLCDVHGPASCRVRARGRDRRRRRQVEADDPVGPERLNRAASVLCVGNCQGMSEKVLTQQLRELEHDGIVHREVHDQVPPKVEYSLTPLGARSSASLRWGSGANGTSTTSPPCALDQGRAVSDSRPQEIAGKVDGDAGAAGGDSPLGVEQPLVDHDSMLPKALSRSAARMSYGTQMP